LHFAFTTGERIVPIPTNAKVGVIAAGDQVISPAADYTVTAAQAVDRIRAGTTKDKVISLRTGQRS
jgi:hypothetical protein